MIPVELRLNNFMSYGTRAPLLDFGVFHVACLSGRNGQGKSALLDAITWALWGEARKSSGSHKPDEELLRIGTREMEVELVFDLEGERYRVTRSFARSATGKTSRPGLELHVLEPTSDSYRPLTGASMRDTQEILDRLLGIDYDTFINSAFLLQGRSDEFTKKRPSERKEILARILNLGRYDRLADLARVREHEARDRLAQAEVEMERLRQALEEESGWKEQRTAAEADIREVQARLETLRAEEQKLTERLAGLDARAREADDIRQALDRLAERRTQHEQDAEALCAKIAEAEALIAQQDQIKKDYDRYEALQQERERLDMKRDLHRGIEMQIQQRESELKDRRNELEKRLHTLEVDLKSNRAAYEECGVRLAEAPVLRRLHEKALAARRSFDEMTEVLRQRKAYDEQIGEVERILLGLREALNGQVQALDEQIRQEETVVPLISALERQQVELTAACRTQERLQAAVDGTRKEGQELAEELKERQGHLAALCQELEKQQQRFAQFRSADGGTCPTCGTELTPRHRRDVEAQYRETLQALEARIEEGHSWIREHEARRGELRATYRELQGQLEPYEGAAGRLATVEEQLRNARETAKTLEEKRARLAALRQQVEEKAYGEEERQRWRQLRQERDALPFDEEKYEQLRAEAVRVGPYEDQLRELEQVAGRREQLEKSIAQLDRQVETARAQLDDGSAFRPVQQQIDQLRAQLSQIDFSPRRFDEVRQALRELSQAGARMKDLLNARQNHTDWKEQLASTQERRAAVDEERQSLTEKLVRVEAELEVRPKLEAEQRATTTECKAAEAQLHALQVQLGELQARLAQARRDREALKACREKLAEAKAQRTLYRHLRAAFGKHGIPSLIIENTLPEIEERANTLLDRLTEGRMHVKLETLKDKKTGGTKETLEIIITDEQGVPRAYETFSGGEAFRVNFALRIALAQLLAERSGVRVRTLVIDEGFGTQDTQGVQNMVEAIQTIQDDFDKILVITHLHELKEAFPVRIEVEKDPLDGSSFEIFGV